MDYSKIYKKQLNGCFFVSKNIFIKFSKIKFIAKIIHKVYTVGVIENLIEHLIK